MPRSRPGCETESPDARRLRRVTLAALAVLISAVFFWMIRQFLVPLLLAALLTALSRPLFLWLKAHLGGRPTPASVATVLLVSLIVVLPICGFFTLLTFETISLSAALRPWLEQASTTDLSATFKDTELYRLLSPHREQILTRAGALAGQVGAYAAAAIKAIVQGAATFAFMLFVMLYALFYFLTDGRQVLSKILYYLPLPAEDEQRMLDKFVSVTRATVKGTLLIGALQGALAGVGFWAAGIPGALVWGTIMAVLSAVPGVGAPIVWVPGVAYVALTGHVAPAVALFAWCGLVVGSVDNVLRPRMVGRDTKMPDLLVLLSTLGGIILFGATGVIIGPIVAALFVTVWDLYGIAFQDILPRARPAAEPTEGGPDPS